MPFSIDLLQNYQMMAFAAGLIVLLFWEQINPFYGFFKDLKQRSLHDFKNLLLGSINAAVISLIFVSAWLAAAQWAYEYNFGLLHRFNFSITVHAAGAILLLDGWMYIWHRANHVLPFLWRFHRVHHSDPNMDVTTASRFHVGEIILSSALRIPVIILLGVHAGELLIYETIAFAVVQLHHANISFIPAVDKAFRILFVSPNMHKIHHSDWKPETDSNYSSLFSFWDRIGRSFRMRSTRNFKTLSMGLKQFNEDRHEKLTSLFKIPFLSVQDTDKKVNRSERDSGTNKYQAGK